MRAKKRFNRRMLALLLSAVMIAEPATSAAVAYAAEPIIEQTVDSAEDANEKEKQDTPETEGGKEETDSGKTDGEGAGSEENGGGESAPDESGSGESGSDENGSGESGSDENGSGENGSGENGSGEGDSSENDDENQETDKDGEDVGSEEEIPSDETAEEEPKEDTDEQDAVSDNDLEEGEEEKEEEDEDNWQGTGHKAPKLEMNLTSAMVSEKRELKGTSERLQVLSKNAQYKSNEAVFLASSKQYAETVAEGYGASLESYEEGVAIMSFPDEVTDIVAMAEDEKVKLPAVYPNYWYTTCNDIVISSEAMPIEDSNAIMAVNNDDPFLKASAGEAYQYYHEDIRSTAAWNYNDTAGSGIKVAVIDSGVQKNHEDLKGRVASAAVTYSTPYNKAEDNDGHGTHVSGIIAATANNGKGGAGIAYKASIVSYKALEENPATGQAGGSTADIIKAVNASVKSGARVINMSLGGNYYDALFEAAVDAAVNKGIVVVAAAGNGDAAGNGLELSTEKPTASKLTNYYSPACFNNVITVSAKEKGQTALTGFSNYGAGIVDITAPGRKIASSVPSGSGYVWMDGTSQATPMVAAAAAYILSVSPDLKNNKTKSAVDTVKKIIQDSATKSGYADSSRFGAGLLNVEAAVKMAAPVASTQGGTGELTVPVVKKGADVVANNAIIQDTDEITLSATVGGAENSEVKIYYTTDGKAPTEKSTLYTAPFSIPASGNKTIKAVAVYYGKKSKVTSVKVKVNANMTSFSIVSKTNSVCLGAGKTMNLMVDTKTVEPAYATNKKVTWEIVDYGNAGSGDVTIKANGQLKAAATIASKTTIKVKATAQDDGKKTAVIEITLLPKVSSLTLTAPVLSNKKPYPLAYAATAETVQMTVAVAPVEANTGISYTSSNAKVASVSDTGLVTAVGNGKATITAKTTDGSNKKVTLQVQVTKKMQSVTVKSKTGETQVAAGKTLQMVADVTSDATNKNVKWSISAGDAATINEKNGKLTAKPSSQVSTVSTVKVKAEALDESGKFGEMTITVYPALTGTIAFEEGTTKNLGTTKIGSLDTSIQLHPFTKADAGNFFGRQENSGDTGLDNFTYTSSNTKIATVNTTGLVTVAGKTGTAKIKVVARDGSGKNASFTVKVVNPVTSISIYSKTGSNVVGKGKTLALGAAVGGNASSKKLKWTSSDTSIATVDQNGKVKGIKYDSSTLESRVIITAEATDGSKASRSVAIYVQPAITKLMYRYRTIFGQTGWSSSVVDTTYLSDAPNGTINNWTNGQISKYALASRLPYYFDESSGDNYRIIVEDGTEYDYWDWNSVSCTCSNSNVIQIADVEVGQGQYMQFWIPVNKGKATLTFKALDGSGKSAKLTITVK